MYAIAVADSRVRHLVDGEIQDVERPWRDVSLTLCGRRLVPFNYYDETVNPAQVCQICAAHLAQNPHDGVAAWPPA